MHENRLIKECKRTQKRTNSAHEKTPGATHNFVCSTEHANRTPAVVVVSNVLCIIDQPFSYTFTVKITLWSPETDQNAAKDYPQHVIAGQAQGPERGAAKVCI